MPLSKRSAKKTPRTEDRRACHPAGEIVTATTSTLMVRAEWRRSGRCNQLLVTVEERWHNSETTLRTDRPFSRLYTLLCSSLRCFWRDSAKSLQTRNYGAQVLTSLERSRLSASRAWTFLASRHGRPLLTHYRKATSETAHLIVISQNVLSSLHSKTMKRRPELQRPYAIPKSKFVQAFSQ